MTADLQLNNRNYSKGLYEVAEGCFAYLQPDGGWGWSNAGLVRGGGETLLVDTLFDLRLTRDMLETMRTVTASAPIRTLVNTHANGDHCYGNQLVEGAEIIAAEAAAQEMGDVPPAALAAMLKGDLPPEVQAYVRECFGSFDFEGITPTLPTRTFSTHLSLEAAGQRVELIEVGPAHTRGDVLAVLPREKVIFTGDILFIGGAPIAWAGPLRNWIAACDLILGLDVDVVVPGHGPVTDKAGVVTVRDELAFVEREATVRHEAGLSAWDAAQEIYRLAPSDLGERGRVAVNVETVYRNLDPSYRSADVVELFRRMATLEA